MMAKVLYCSDVVKGYDFVARGEAEEEVLQKATEHGRSEHGMETTEEVEGTVRKLTREE